MKKIMIPLAALLLTACGSSDKKTAEAASKDSTKVEAPADTAKASPVDAVSGATAKANEITFHGTITVPPEYVASASVTMGGQVKSTTIMAGKYVNRGAVIAVLNNPEFVQLQQTYLDANAQTDYLSAEFLRQKTLSEGQAAAEKKMQQARADYRSMKSRRDAAAMQLRLLGINPASLVRGGIRSYLTIHAPISGYVSDVSVNIGKYINPGDELCKIVDKNHIMVKLTAYEKDLEHLRIGQAVEFRVSGIEGSTFHAVISSIGQKVDEVSRSVDVFATIQSKQQLFRPGMYVTARVQK